MIVALGAAQVALAAPEAMETLAELEWRRAEPSELMAAVSAAADPATRADAARAIGRLRDPDAVAELRLFASDLDDPEVRVAAAEALGWTPGGETVLRPWAHRLLAVPEPAGPPAPLGLLAAVTPHAAELEAVLVGLGRVGEQRDVALLTAASASPWPVGGAAARALGELSVRAVPGLDATVVDALVHALAAPDPRTVDDAAWALSRLKPALGHRTAEVRARLSSGASPQARAWLVRAAWPSLDAAERGELFLEAMTDAPRLVQIAVLQALTPGDVEPEVLAPFLHASDSWVRAAAIEALGRHRAATDGAAGEGVREILLRAATEGQDVHERARAVLALDLSDPARAGDAALPVPLRSAWIQTLDDVPLLVELAVGAEVPVLRTAAAGALAELEEAGPSQGTALVAATDPLVRGVGAELLGKVPGPEAVSALIVLLSAESDRDVRAVAWRELDEALVGKLATGRTKDPALVAVVAKAPGLDDGPAAEHVRAVAARMKLPIPVVNDRRAMPEEVTLALGSGGAATVRTRPEDLEEIRRIRSAVVRTDAGTFVLGLDPERAPLAVATFAGLAEAGWFDGLSFHRVVPGFVVQTGCPRGDGWGGPGFVLPDEDSEAPFTRGSLGMAREPSRDTGGSQWFVTTSDQPHLTSEYTRFGEVLQGQIVVDHLAQGAVVLDVIVERVGAAAR